MQDVSLYELLDVPVDASDDKIRLAFLNLAHQYHPDLHGSEQEDHDERFKQIRHAYEILSNPERREIYDRTHDTYGTIIRQAAPFSADEKLNTKNAATTFAFQTKRPKDQIRNWDGWLFALSVVASVAITVWAAQYIIQLRQRITTPSRSAINHAQEIRDVKADPATDRDNSRATVDLPDTNDSEAELQIPRNPAPTINRNYKKQFEARMSASGQDKNEQHPEPIPPPNELFPRKRKTANKRPDPLNLDDPMTNGAESFGMPFPRRANTVNPNDYRTIAATDFKTMRIELQSEYYNGSMQFRRSGVPWSNRSTPSQADLANESFASRLPDVAGVSPRAYYSQPQSISPFLPLDARTVSSGYAAPATHSTPNSSSPTSYRQGYTQPGYSSTTNASTYSPRGYPSNGYSTGSPYRTGPTSQYQPGYPSSSTSYSSSYQTYP